VLRRQIAAVSVGLTGGAVLLDLDYSEDAAAEVDLNVVMTAAGEFVEVQGTAEGEPFARAQLDLLLERATVGIRDLCALQLRSLEDESFLYPGQ